MSDAMNAVLRPCKNMSANELMHFVCHILIPVNRLQHGDASDLTQDQVPLPWMRITLNDLLTVVREYYPESLSSAALDIQKDLVERLSLLAVYRSSCESTYKFEVFKSLMKKLINNSADL